MSSHGISIYRGFNEQVMAQRVARLEQTFKVARIGKEVDYNAKVWLFENQGNLAIWIRNLGNLPFQEGLEIGRELDCPWMHLQFREHILWEYFMYKGSDLIEHFSAWPGVTSGSEKGAAPNGKMLAEIWGVDESSIADYLKPWNVGDEELKAYPHDSFSRGSPDQGYDFMRSLTGIRIP